MRPGVTPHYISPLLPFQHGTNSVLDTAVTDHDINTSSGISKDGKLIWLIRGPVLEILSSVTRQCVASWVFGVSLKDTHSYITCVKEYCYGNHGSRQKLLVGVCNALKSSMVCVLDIRTSRVTKVIEIPHKVFSIESVTSVGGDFIPLWALNDQLRLFHGIIAVGTISGIVYLIDMCIDEDFHSDEVMPSKLQYITPRSRDAAERRKEALAKGHHLCLVLDEESNGNQYKYRRCDGTVLKTFSSDDVIVSCMKYFPQIGTLVVGFSFGSYQLWKLNIPVLEYSSRVESDAGSVLHVAYQEPENDPKNFCYLWIVRGGDTDVEETVSSSSLYQLAYNKKTWYSNYGAFYEELTSVSLRFDIDLTANLFNTASKTSVSSRAITCYTLEDPNYSPPARLNDEESFEESVHGPDLSRCLFVWESLEGSGKKTYQMAVFDMNRWYHAQMPAALRCTGGNMDTCPYLSFHCLDNAVDSSIPDTLLSVHICTESMRKFINTSPLPPEQHFYPASLAFDALLVVESGVIKGHFLGTQRQVLASMEKIGPSILLNCKELYNLCIYMGLLPRPLDIASHNPTPVQMRENILTMALDYNMLPFIIKCVQDWSPGEYVHLGCTLKFVLDWAWSCVSQIKMTIDKTCIPLYDWSRVVIDNRSIQTLHQAYQKLCHLTAIFKSLLNQASPTTEQGFIQLQNKLSVVMYISQHLQVVLWFIGAGLLPEHDEVEEGLLPGQYSYPAGSLMQAFNLRRQELQKLHEDICETDLLLIDGLVREMGPAVNDLWYKEGGKGQYPPPSLHALLSVYLLEGIDLMKKHALLLYCLLDLVSLVDPALHEQFSEKISKFTKALCIPFSVVKQVQGFWLLDHKDFEESMVVILDPLVTDDLGDWQHGRIIKSLLYQGDCKMALRYISSKRPLLSSPQEIKIKLTVLLANGFTAEALEYQRTFRDEDNIEDLLHHLFQGSQQTKTIDQLLQLPLTDSEEKKLIEYLSDSKEPHSQELLVLHYLQRARYVEAIQLNEKLKHNILSEPSSKARERSAARNAMIEGFFSLLSGVQRKLVFENQTVPKKNKAKRREVRKPQPLSTTVTKNSHSKIVSKTSLFLEILERVQEVKCEEEEEHLTTKNEAESQVGPFICTPVTPRTKSVFGHTQPVVYFNQQEGNQQKSLPWQPTLTSALTPFNLTKMMSPVSTKRTSKILGADALSMLQTPVPQRKSLSRSRQSTSVPPTPQSILKVRQFISNKSPQVSPTESLPKVAEVEPTVSLPGTPRSVSFRDTTAQGTPKQLRFTDKSEITTSAKGHRSILKSPPSPKSVKDRSPTPESISRSPKYKSNLDILQRPPLHEDQSEDVDMEVGVQIDDDITFNYTRNADSGDDSIDTSTEPLDNKSNVMEIEEIEDEPAPPTQVSVLKKSGIMSSPVKLRHSPLKMNTTPRSPTIKLSRSPARGMIPPVFTMPEDDNSKSLNQPSDEIPPQPVFPIGQSNQPIGIDSEKEEPIEIDDTDEEEADVNEEEPERKHHVSFGGVLEHEEVVDQDYVSSEDTEEDLYDRITEIENRIIGFTEQEVEEEDPQGSDINLKPQSLFRKKRERSINFVLPDSSSDNQVSSEEEISKVVIEEAEDGEEVHENLKERVSTTQDEENLHLEIDSDEVMEEENYKYNDVSSDEENNEHENSGDQIDANKVGEPIEDTFFREDREASSENDGDIVAQSNSEAVITENYSNFIESLTKDIEKSPQQADIDDNLSEVDNVVDIVKEASSEIVQKSSELNVQSGEQFEVSDEVGLPPLTEIEEGCFESKQLPSVFQEEVQKETTQEMSVIKESTSSHEVDTAHRPITRISSVNTETTELRRSSRRLSSMAKQEDYKILSSKKSPGRKKKVDNDDKELDRSPGKEVNTLVNNDIVKSPSRRKSLRNIEKKIEEIDKSPERRKNLSPSETDIAKSPGRRKSIKNLEESEMVKSPSRGKSIKNLEESEEIKSPSRRKSIKNLEESEKVKSPSRRKSIKNLEENEIIKSPSRRKSIKNLEEIEAVKSPSRKKSIKNLEEIEAVKSPSRRKGTKVVEENEMVKSPSRRKSTKNLEENEMVKSPNRTNSRSAKNLDESENDKSPSRRRGLKNLETSEITKSPSRKKNTKTLETSELDKSPSRRKSTKTLETSELDKSPSRRKSTKTLETSELDKSPSRRKSTKTLETSELDKSPSRRKSTKTLETSEMDKSPSRRKSMKSSNIDTDVLESKSSEDFSVQKSPGRTRRAKKAEDETNITLSSPIRKQAEERLKSPSRKKGNKIIENEEMTELDTKDTVLKEDLKGNSVTKSPGRKKKTEESFTSVKSPSRISGRILRSQSPPSRDAGHQEEQKNEPLTPPESEVESPSKNKRGGNSISSTRSRKSRQTLSRKSNRLEDQSATSDVSETESEGIPPVFSFSDPMQIDVPTDEFTKVKDSSDMQSFIFSPPVQTRTRRSSFTKEPSPFEHSILLPSTSRETTPVRSREGTPVKSTSKRGRGRKSSTTDISVPVSIPEEPPGTIEEEAKLEEEPPIKKEKRSKRGKKKLLNYDEVNLISPIKEEEGEIEVERPLTRQGLRRVQEMPIMTLRGGKMTGTVPKKKRVAKLW